MAFARMLRSRAAGKAARRLYGAIVARSRRPEFFLEAGVPDTLDGRFDLLALNASLVLDRLGSGAGAAPELAQALFDEMVVQLDRSVREMGTGDLGVGRRVKAMAAGYYGRARAYEDALAKGDEALDAALRRNLYGTVEADGEELALMAGYVRRQAASLRAQVSEALLAGEVDFVPLREQ